MSQKCVNTEAVFHGGSVKSFRKLSKVLREAAVMQAFFSKTEDTFVSNCT